MRKGLSPRASGKWLDMDCSSAYKAIAISPRFSGSDFRAKETYLTRATNRSSARKGKVKMKYLKIIFVSCVLLTACSAAVLAQDSGCSSGVKVPQDLASQLLRQAFKSMETPQ